MGSMCSKINYKAEAQPWGSNKFDIEKFSGSSDFCLWRIKMQPILIHQGLKDALKGEATLPTTLSIKKKRNISRKNSQRSSKGTNNCCIMVEARIPIHDKIYGQLTLLEATIIVDSNKILDDLENFEVKLEDEDKSLKLLSVLPSSYEHFKDVILFGRDQTIALIKYNPQFEQKNFRKGKRERSKKKVLNQTSIDQNPETSLKANINAFIAIRKTLQKGLF
ncbi:hypothetical protein CR513_25347, partial [Mucuna pruriens]